MGRRKGEKNGRERRQERIERVYTGKERKRTYGGRKRREKRKS